MRVLTPSLCRSALAASLALAGCSGEPSGSFTLTLTGPIEGTIRGGATFCRRPGTGETLLVLRDPDTSAGFLLGRRSPDGVAPGSYAVVAASDSVEGRFWMASRLDSLEGGSEYSFRVDEGSVRIISADSSWLRGRINVRMVASDASLEVDSRTGEIRRLPTEQAGIAGSFTAARAASCDAAEAAG
ncbi:MAG TPA: hypothetical protein VHG28_01210 [Longimicrobiaceae bacterium]|nr:hypothetical protein [Longimicrobiaceae bacterium]